MSALQDARILVVDDEGPIRDLLASHLRSEGFQADTAADGGMALDALSRQPYDLVLSDVRMPGMDGLQLLGEIVRRFPQVAVVMLTGCEDVAMAVTAMKTGSLDYILKPFRLDEVSHGVRQALSRQRDKLREAGYLRDLERVVEEQTVELRRLLADLQHASENTLEALVAALDAREQETHAHSKRVSEYAVHLAREMGVRSPLLDAIRRGAMLHDIGKIGISDTILLKPGSLDEEEWREMRRHPLIGYWILNRIPALQPAAEIVLAHHERFDGAGYPRGLKGEEIPLGARIFSVIDSLDAITTDRPYQKGKPYEAGREEIAGNAGTQFDAQVVEHFLRISPRIWDEIRLRTLHGRTAGIFEIAPLVLN